LLDSDAPPKSNLNDKVFATLPRRVSAAALEKTVERAFENLRSREESRKTRQELRRVASDPGTLNKIGVALSRPLGTCEKIKQLTPRRQDAKTRKEELPCFLCAFGTFAPLREMLLLFGRFLHTFLTMGRFQGIFVPIPNNTGIPDKQQGGLCSEN
jgi:hypothetical protein